MKALRSLALSVCLLVSFAAAAQPHEQPYDDKLGEFEAFAQQQLKAASMPGLSVAVMKDGFVWSKGFGFSDVENQVPATAESAYRLASVTKPMTATAVMKLVEEGKIDLDAEVQTYVPSFPRKQWPVTVRQLLGHLGGISHYRDAAAETHFRDPKNTSEALAVFRDFDLVAEPGTRFSYSSYGYVLLGAIVEAAGGKPYGQVLREKVWGPLGMTATRMDDPRAVIPHRVRGYELRDGKLRNSEYVDVSSRFAAGGTRSTVVDLIAFVRGLDSGKILEPETLDRMWTSQTMKDGRTTQYGLGWEISPIAGRFRVFHDGSQPETNTYLAYVPRAHFAIALATNLEAANLDVFGDRLAQLFLGDDWSSRMWIRGSAGEQAAGIGVLRAFNGGFAYYDRYGKAMTTDPKQLASAFRALNESVDGKQAAREELVKVGSWIAESLASRGVDRYHHEGPFAFFADYSGKPALSPKVRELLARWRADWAKTSAITDAATLERSAASLSGASVIPDFSGELVARGQQTAMRGDVGEALRVAKLAVSLYPDAEGPNGLLGVLLILSGDAAGGEQAARKSAAINRNGYFGPANVLRIAGFLANGPTRPAAIKVLEIAASIYPEDAAVAKALAGLRK